MRLFLGFSRLGGFLESGPFVLLLELSLGGRLDDLFEGHNVPIALFILFRTVVKVTVGVFFLHSTVPVQL